MVESVQFTATTKSDRLWLFMHYALQYALWSWLFVLAWQTGRGKQSDTKFCVRNLKIERFIIQNGTEMRRRDFQCVAMKCEHLRFIPGITHTKRTINTHSVSNTSCHQFICQDHIFIPDENRNSNYSWFTFCQTLIYMCVSAYLTHTLAALRLFAFSLSASCY